jgi:hypothetical protein
LLARLIGRPPSAWFLQNSTLRKTAG